MSEKIPLSNGGWAVLRDPKAVTQRLRRPVEKAFLKVGQGSARAALENAGEITTEAQANRVASAIDPDTLDLFNELNDLIVIARLESWSLDKPLTIDSLLDLPDEDYKALRSAAANKSMEMLPDFSFSNDPDSPTKPSGD